jgi:hypothetical protein
MMSSDYDRGDPYLCEMCGEEIDFTFGRMEEDYFMYPSPRNRDIDLVFCSKECLVEWKDESCCYNNFDDPMYEDFNPCDFRDPGGRSALRNGPLIHPCPNCGEPNMLSPADKARGYQCDRCADQLERGW